MSLIRLLQGFAIISVSSAVAFSPGFGTADNSRQGSEGRLTPSQTAYATSHQNEDTDKFQINLKKRAGITHPIGADCSNQDISQCTELLENLTKENIGFAATREELREMCPVLLDGLQCIDNYTLRCLNPQHRSYFNELYAGTIRVIEDLCNNKGKYQEEYIRHAPCMRTVHPKYNKCSDVYHEKTARLNEVNSATFKLSEEDRRRNVITLCCSFQEYLKCSERIVFETCGNYTARFTREFLNRMAGPIVETKCSRYEPSSDMCMKAYNSSPHTTSSGLLLGSLQLVVISFSLYYYNSFK